MIWIRSVALTARSQDSVRPARNPREVRFRLPRAADDMSLDVRVVVITRSMTS